MRTVPTVTPTVPDTETATPTSTEQPTATPLPADINRDGSVDETDLLYLLQGEMGGEPVDVYPDGRMDMYDYFNFAVDWRTNSIE